MPELLYGTAPFPFCKRKDGKDAGVVCKDGADV